MHPGIHTKSNPDKAAYIMAATGKVVTYRELDDESNRAATLLRSLGLKPATQSHCSPRIITAIPRFSGRRSVPDSTTPRSAHA